MSDSTYTHDMVIVFARRRNRRTGGMVVAQFDDCGYVTICETHDMFAEYTSKSAALSWMAHPEDWCSECAKATR